MRVLVVDNYDSFVYNLVQYLGQLGADVEVHRNDAIAPSDLDALGVDGVLLSSITAPLEARVVEALGIAGAARPHWCRDGEAISPQTVHAAQLRWYRDNPDFVDLTVERHGIVMELLGLLTRSGRV